MEALFVLGMATSRKKDLYDLELPGRQFDFGPALVDAVVATLARRETTLPSRLRDGLSDDFAADATKQAQWRAFLRKSGAVEMAALEEVARRLRGWLWPVLGQAAEGGRHPLHLSRQKRHQ